MVLWICYAAVLNHLASRATTARSLRMTGDRFAPLPDLGFDLLPALHVRLPDLALAFLLVWTTWVCVANKINTTAHLFVLGATYTLRAFIVVLTIPPSPLDPSTSSWVGTHDLMYSGHCLFYFTCLSLLGSPPWLYVVFALTLVASRQHYTVDVVMSWIVWRWATIELQIQPVSA